MLCSLKKVIQWPYNKRFFLKRIFYQCFPLYVVERKNSPLIKRFLSDPQTLLDEEFLELMLSLSSSQCNAKYLIKTLIERFGSFKKAISAPIKVLKDIPDLDFSCITTLKIIEEHTRRLLKREIQNKPLLREKRAVLDYCHAMMDQLNFEQFRILFLNKKGFLVHEEVLPGTIDAVPLYPRDIIRNAFLHCATDIIMIHNHPTGDARPSNSDIWITKKLQKALNAVNLKLLDHFIVGKFGDYSLRENEDMLIYNH